MPKLKNSVSELRHMRIQERQSVKKKVNAYPPSEIYLCVLGNGAAGSPRCLYMFCDNSRYLFNCGEGTQRLAHEYKLKLSKLEHVFTTHKSWENLGGLLGLSLTIQDIGVPQITLHGPHQIESLYTSTKSFIMTRNMHISKRAHTDTPFVDSCVEVHYILIYKSKNASGNKVSCNGHESNTKEIPSAKRQKVDEEAESENYDVVMAYACRGHKKKGHLMVEKCVELGVTPGPLYGKLKNGEDVTLPSGKIVRSEEVTSPDQLCPVFLVVECPSEEFLIPFTSEEKFRAYQCTDVAEALEQEIAQLVVHFTPPHIVRMPHYQEWMNRFPDTTCHLFLNEDSANANSIAIARIQYLLNLLHPRVFSLLQETELPKELSASCSNRVQSDTLYKYHLRPYKGLDKSMSICLDPEAYIAEARNTPGFEDSLKELKTSLKRVEEEAHKGTQYPEVVFLGTGSCIPSKVRNVSCILVNISADSSMFLDCGEGSYCQLLRLYGASEADSILMKMSCIFISHMHADHHLGLFTLLKRRKEALEKRNVECSPIVVIAPYWIKGWLEHYDRNFESVSQLYRFIDCSTLKFDARDISTEDESFILHACQNLQICTVPVQHCPSAYGVTLQLLKDNWKLVYSGDTIPCQQLIDAGKDCTLLIHEATMEDDLEDEAALKMHSTTSQAISVAEEMGAKYTILTHFSQRYAKVPMLHKRLESHIGCAFDNMKVRNCDLPIISLFIPTLQILFAEHIEKLQDKSNKRKEKLKQACDSPENSLNVNM